MTSDDFVRLLAEQSNFVCLKFRMWCVQSIGGQAEKEVGRVGARVTRVESEVGGVESETGPGAGEKSPGGNGAPTDQTV